MPLAAVTLLPVPAAIAMARNQRTHAVNIFVELPLRPRNCGVVAYVPARAGLMATQFVIRVASGFVEVAIQTETNSSPSRPGSFVSALVSTFSAHVL